MAWDPELATRLDRSLEETAAALSATEGRQDSSPRPGHWSFRSIAAHLAATERDCFLDRARRIAAGESPRFGFYSDEAAGFSGAGLADSLAAWRRSRADLLALARGLTPEQQRLTGEHATFGPVTVGRYLEIAFEHDQEHLREVREGDGSGLTPDARS